MLISCFYSKKKYGTWSASRLWWWESLFLEEGKAVGGSGEPQSPQEESKMVEAGTGARWGWLRRVARHGSPCLNQPGHPEAFEGGGEMVLPTSWALSPPSPLPSWPTLANPDLPAWPLPVTPIPLTQSPVIPIPLLSYVLSHSPPSQPVTVSTEALPPPPLL